MHRHELGYLPFDVKLPAQGEGPLTGLTFAIKDVFDVAGHVTGFGHPAWRDGRVPAAETAPAVTALLQSGANLNGRTICDEICYSLTGVNPYYGTPINPRAPDAVPGGSSSGSASAVATGAADFSLGTDCGGSVRVPASYCGIFGFRPTHGAISTCGVIALAASFDTVGMFAADMAVLAKVADVLLPQEAVKPFGELIIAIDAIETLSPQHAALCNRWAMEFSRRLGLKLQRKTIISGGFDATVDVFRILQASEILAAHGEWIVTRKPRFSEPVQQRLAWASQLRETDIVRSRAARGIITQELDGLLAENNLVILPTAGPAPSIASEPDELDIARRRTLALTSPSGLAGLPQLQIPIGFVEDRPVGLSLVGARGADRTVIAAGTHVCT